MTQNQECEALQQAMLAEKGSLQEAYANRLISDEDWLVRSLEIDERL